jgi:hypothetical protein
VNPAAIFLAGLLMRSVITSARLHVSDPVRGWTIPANLTPEAHAKVVVLCTGSTCS